MINTADKSAMMDRIEAEVNEASELSDRIYTKYFGSYFLIQQELYQRVQDQSRPITDAELEKVLTELPLELIDVAESYAKFQLGEEVIKLRFKEESADKTSDAYKEYELMSKIYGAVNERVHRQISFSRELIMSCKKIWDRRRDTDNANPVGPVDTTLPEYKEPNKPNTYVG